MILTDGALFIGLHDLGGEQRHKEYQHCHFNIFDSDIKYCLDVTHFPRFLANWSDVLGS